MSGTSRSRSVHRGVRAAAALLAMVVATLGAAPGGAARSDASSTRPAGVDPAAIDLRLTKVVGGLSRPVFATHAGNSDLYIVEQTGKIRILRGGALLERPFLNASSLIYCCGEAGLLGLAFHPGYADPASAGYRRFYVTYAQAGSTDYVLAEFRRRLNDPDRADPTSRRVLLDLKKPFPYHWAGMIAFGPDGYLWVGTGDGGHEPGYTAEGDPLNIAQDINKRLGKILRFDPLDRDGAGPLKYAIPADNPFVGKPGLDEIWAIGLRNPWRWSFDRLTGDFWLTDVGHSYWEEVNRARSAAGRGRGHNYGWRLKEGNHCYRPRSGCDPDRITVKPFHEYVHNFNGGGDFNCAITGGYVYRGTASPVLFGRYLFNDHCSGRIWSLDAAGPRGQTAIEHRDTARLISSFAEDVNGELYVMDLANGSLYRLSATGG